MFRLIKQKFALSFVVCLLLCSVRVFACDCRIGPNQSGEDAVKNAVKDSTMVFAGKVVGFEYRQGIFNEYFESLNKQAGKQLIYETLVVKFQVEQWWKGDSPSEVYLVTDEIRISDGSTALSSCNYYFKDGESYLVYAHGKENELQTSNCSRTKILSKNDDFKFLGKGRSPVE